MARLVLRVLLIVGTLLHQGTFIQCSCPAIIKCPFALYSDGSSQKGLPKSMVFQTSPTIPGESDNSTIKDCTMNYGMCVSNPCENNATCMDMSFWKYKCQCAPGYKGHRCQFVVQLLIKSFDRRGVQIANIFDLMFSTFFANHFVTIDSFDFDKWERVLYWADVRQPATRPPIYDIRMSQGTNNWTTFSEKEEDIVDIKVLEASRRLYWASKIRLKWSPLLPRRLEQLHRVRAVNITKLPEPVYRFEIDQQRRYLYFISSSEIFRMTLDGEEYTQIINLTVENTVSGFTMDEEDQRLFWSIHLITLPYFFNLFTQDQRLFWSVFDNGHIFYHDLTRNYGSTLVEYKDRSIANVLFTVGWLIWLNHRDLSVCVSRALQGGQLEYCRPPERQELAHVFETNGMALL